MTSDEEELDDIADQNDVHSNVGTRDPRGMKRRHLTTSLTNHGPKWKRQLRALKSQNTRRVNKESK